MFSTVACIDSPFTHQNSLLYGGSRKNSQGAQPKVVIRQQFGYSIPSKLKVDFVFIFQSLNLSSVYFYILRKENLITHLGNIIIITTPFMAWSVPAVTSAFRTIPSHLPVLHSSHSYFKPQSSSLNGAPEATSPSLQRHPFWVGDASGCSSLHSGRAIL